MVWYKILAALKAHLAAAQVAQIIELGAINPENLDLEPGVDGRYGAVFLVRGRETEEELFNGGEGTAYFYAENWVRSDDPDPADGYRLLAAQEARCKAAMAEFFAMNDPVPDVEVFTVRELPPNGVEVYAVGKAGPIDIVYTSLEETVGDADSVRPRVGSRMTVKVQWSTRTI